MKSTRRTGIFVGVAALSLLTAAVIAVPALASTTTGVEPGVAMGTGTPSNKEVNSSGVRYICIKAKLYTLAAVEVDGASKAMSEAVVPGDVMRATVTTSAKTTMATIADTTKGHTFTLTKSGTGGTSFVEDVYDDCLVRGTTQVGIADFGSISFTEAAVSGKALGWVKPRGAPYNMKTRTGIVQILTGALTGRTKNAFTTTWKHS
jgi:hypothetical protein